MQSPALQANKKPVLILVVVASVCAMVWVGASRLIRGSWAQGDAAVKASSVPVSTTPNSGIGIAGIGWVEPEHGVIQVAAPLEAGTPPIVDRLFVNEGDLVQRGQVLATLTSAPNLNASVNQAKTRVELARRHLAQLQAGPHPGEVEALQSQIERLQADRKVVEESLKRQQALLDKDYIARAVVDQTRVQMHQTDAQIAEARQRIRSLSEVREADVQLAETEIRAAQADLAAVEVRLRNGAIRAAQSGRVLNVKARPGEAIGPGGLLDLAPNGDMTVMAEIYETDAKRIRPGQNATITAEVLSQPLMGSVVWISPAIQQRSTPSLDPAAYSEARVFQARIAVKDSSVLKDLIHAKVNVVIQP